MKNPNIVSDSLMIHRTRIIDAGNRVPFFISLLKGKKVLHTGCTDSPRFDPNNNLHITLASHVQDLHGYDIDKEAIEILRTHVNKPLFHTYSDIKAETYDGVLIPEVIEHIFNPGLFLKDMMDLDTQDIVLLAPNMIETLRHNVSRFGWVKDETGSDCYLETVHNDHVCFYTPKTLATLIEKSIAAYCPDKWVLGPMFMCEISVGCIMRKA